MEENPVSTKDGDAHRAANAAEPAKVDWQVPDIPPSDDELAMKAARDYWREIAKRPMVTEAEIHARRA